MGCGFAALEIVLEQLPHRDGDEIKSASGRSRVRQNAGLRREFQARVLAKAATNAGFIDARFLSLSRLPSYPTGQAGTPDVQTGK